MTEKRTKVCSKKVLEYTVIPTPVGASKRLVKVPRITEQATVSMDELLEKAKESGYITSQPSYFKSQFEVMMSLVMDYLESGKAVNLDGYLRIQPYLKGNVNETGKLTRNNALAVRVTTLSKMKMHLSKFAWRLKGDRVKVLW